MPALLRANVVPPRLPRASLISGLMYFMMTTVCSVRPARGAHVGSGGLGAYDCCSCELQGREAADDFDQRHRDADLLPGDQSPETCVVVGEHIETREGRRCERPNHAIVALADAAYAWRELPCAANEKLEACGCCSDRGHDRESRRSRCHRCDQR